MSDSDLYGDDIRLWSERQAALLRRLAAGEAVSEQVDWPHVVEEIEDLGHGDAHPPVQDEIAQLTARLAAAEALVKELRARLDSLTGKLAETQAVWPTPRIEWRQPPRALLQQQRQSRPCDRPAHENSTSIGPPQSSTAPAMLAGSRRSSEIFLAQSYGMSAKSATTTSPPSWATRLAVAAPMPDAPPTTNTLPSSGPARL